MAVITVSRSLGAEGEAIALQVARQLGIPYLDREIIREVADQVGIAEEALAGSERVPSLLDRMLTAMAAGSPDLDIATWPYDPGIRRLDTISQYRQLIEQFIRTIAESGSAVIVGHGATAILANYPRVLRCLFVAPLPVRIERVMLHEGIDRKGAERRIADTDNAWRDFLKTYYSIDLMQPLQYDLVINTAHVSADSAVAIVVEAAKGADAVNR